MDLGMQFYFIGFIRLLFRKIQIVDLYQLLWNKVAIKALSSLTPFIFSSFTSFPFWLLLYSRMTRLNTHTG